MTKYTTAQEIYNLLSEGVHGQEDAKRVIASSVARHLVCSDPNYKGEYQKANALIIGKSGTGKTELMRQLRRTQSRWNDSPFPITSFDASKLTGTGFKGLNSEDILVQLHLENESQFLSATERGIIHLDEIDKLITAEMGNYATGSLNALLTMVEGAMISIESAKVRDARIRVEKKDDDDDSYISTESLKSVDTSKILFIFSGVFENFEKTFQNKTLGFLKDDESSENIIYTHEELMKRALIPAELMGRISQITTTHHIPAEQLVDALNKICLHKYKPLLNAYNIRYKSVFTKKFLTDIVSNGYSKHMGMRLCYSKIDEHLAGLLFDKKAIFEANEAKKEDKSKESISNEEKTNLQID